MTYTSPVVDVSKLEQLRSAIEAEDWSEATDLCLDIDLETRDPIDRFRVEELVNAARLRQSEYLLELISGLGLT